MPVALGKTRKALPIAALRKNYVAFLEIYEEKPVLDFFKPAGMENIQTQQKHPSFQRT